MPKHFSIDIISFSIYTTPKSILHKHNFKTRQCMRNYHACRVKNSNALPFLLEVLYFSVTFNVNSQLEQYASLYFHVNKANLSRLKMIAVNTENKRDIQYASILNSL
ncbi:hypothetical protein V1477_002801 [Vespula maculifrons]|uniref:Uncharacterized protein n=1 Tax=Vespula maculifrons TaxID=7453 RepID=A0ABD2CW11_VESMC